jgi:serine/threonine-protein kinase
MPKPAAEPPEPAKTAAPAVTPAAATTTAAAEAEVELQVDSKPKEVEIFVGGERVGTSSSPIKLKKGKAVKVTFKASGYKPLEREISGEKDEAIAIELARAAAAGGPPPAAPPAGAPKKKPKSDLEF